MKKKLLENFMFYKKGQILDKVGQLQQTWRTQPAGNKNIEFFDNVGQLLYSITPEGIILNKVGQKMGEIQPKTKKMTEITAKTVLQKINNVFNEGQEVISKIPRSSLINTIISAIRTSLDIKLGHTFGSLTLKKDYSPNNMYLDLSFEFDNPNGQGGIEDNLYLKIKFDGKDSADLDMLYSISSFKGGNSLILYKTRNRKSIVFSPGDVDVLKTLYTKVIFATSEIFGGSDVQRRRKDIYTADSAKEY